MDVNRSLLTDVLRHEWGFEGFVTSDWVFGTHDAVVSLQAGMDVEMPLRLLRARDLPAALLRGNLARATVLRSARRILRTSVLHAATREVASPSATQHLAVIGRLAERANLGDHGSSRVQPPSTVSPLQGLREALPSVRITTASGRDERVAAVAAAAAETAIVLVGLDQHDEGESVVTGGVDVGVLGRAFGTGPLRGLLIGRALASVLTGGAEPVGRLPFVLPTDAAHLPSFDRAATSVIYDDKWGQRRFDGEGHAPAFPFGFGLGYTTIEHRLLDHSFDEAGGSADVVVTNTGDREGSTVVQVYAADVSIRRPVAQLLGFRKVTMQPGGERTVQVTLDAGPTLQRDPATRCWSPRTGNWALLRRAGDRSAR